MDPTLFRVLFIVKILGDLVVALGMSNLVINYFFNYEKINLKPYKIFNVILKLFSSPKHSLSPKRLGRKIMHTRNLPRLLYFASKFYLAKAKNFDFPTQPYKPNQL